MIVTSLSISSFQGNLLTANSCIAWTRLLLCTAVWYLFAQMLFPAVEEMTGVCRVSSFLSKETCRRAGHTWTGLDISGHCFLLSWNCLVILEELPQIPVTRSLLSSTSRALLHLLVLLWEGMMLATSLYFHTETEKVLGVICAIVPWAIIYKLLPRVTTILKLPLKLCDIDNVLLVFPHCILLNHRCYY